MQTEEPNTIASRRRAGKAWIFVLVGLLIAGGAVALFLILRNKDVDEFDLVPRDALGFMTIRVADALETEPVKRMKDMIVKAAGRDGAQFMQQLSAVEEEFGLKLTDVERVTMVIKEGPPPEGRGEPIMWFAIRTKKDIDKDRILSFIKKTGEVYEEQKHEGRVYYSIGKRGEAGLCFLSSRLAVIAPGSGMKKCLEVAKNGPGKGPLEDAIKLASGDKYHLVAAGNITDILRIPDARKDLERSAARGDSVADLAKMVLNMKTVLYTVRIDKKLSVDLTAEFDSADAAKEAVTAVEAGLALARKEIKPRDRQRPELKPLLDAMDLIKPKASGSTVTVSVEMDTDPLVTALMFWVGRGGSDPDQERRPKQPKPEDPQALPREK